MILAGMTVYHNVHGRGGVLYAQLTCMGTLQYCILHRRGRTLTCDLKGYSV